jgi:hypothetical protein
MDVHFKSKPEAKDLKIVIFDKAGKQVREIRTRDLKLDAGVNRLVWDLRTDAPVPPVERPAGAAEAGEGGGGGGGFGQGPARGVSVDPGEYRVEISLGTSKSSKTFKVEEDPRVTFFSDADRAKRRAAIAELFDLYKQADGLRKKFVGVDASLKALQTAWKRPDAAKMSDEVKKAAETLQKSLDELRPSFVFSGGAFGPPPTPEELKKPEPAFTLPPLTNRVSQLIAAMDSFSAAPSPSQLEQVALVKKALLSGVQRIDKLTKEDVVRLNDAMSKAKVPYITVP